MVFMKYFGAFMKCNTTAGYYYHKLGSGFVTSVYDKDFPKMKINYQRNLLVFFPDKPKTNIYGNWKWSITPMHTLFCYLIFTFVSDYVTKTSKYMYDIVHEMQNIFCLSERI